MEEEEKRTETEESVEEQPKKKKKWLIILCAILIFLVAVFGVLQAGSIYTENSWSRWTPDYTQIDISPLLEKEILTEENYESLYRQTGLTASAIDDMRNSDEGRKKILKIQKALFTDYKVESRMFAPFTYMDEIDGFATLCSLKDGDIIVSSTTRVSWWRWGHACIVVDGEREIIAESVGPFSESETVGASVNTYLANFLVLRPKIDEKTKEKIADFVQAEMLGIPYRFTAGLIGKKYKENLKYSQCAHFVWYAYKKFGYDLDSNGGKLVKPQDIALSEQVEVVQAFGYDLDKLWS